MNSHMPTKVQHASTKTSIKSVEWLPLPYGEHNVYVRDEEPGEVPSLPDAPFTVVKKSIEHECTFGTRKDSVMGTSGHSTRSQTPDLSASLEQSMDSLTTDDPDTLAILQCGPSLACLQATKILQRRSGSIDNNGPPPQRECKPFNDVHHRVWHHAVAALSKFNLVEKIRKSDSPEVLLSYCTPGILIGAPSWNSGVRGDDIYFGSSGLAAGSGAQGGNAGQQQQHSSTQRPEGCNPTTAHGQIVLKADQSSLAKFPCVFHRWDLGGDPTPACKTKQRWVSHLRYVETAQLSSHRMLLTFRRVHHSAQSHTDGPFLYCQKCYTKDFDSSEELEQHLHACRLQICIRESCPNYGTDPGEGSGCAWHPAKPSQRLKWRKLYRLAHNLDLRVAIPETGGGTPSPGTPASGSRPQTIRSPTTSLYSATMSRGNSHRSHGARSRSTSRAGDQPPFSSQSPAHIIQDLGLPADPPLLPGSPVSSDRPTLQLLTIVGQQLEDLAKSMLRAVINGDNILDPALSGWYDAVMHPSTIRHEQDTVSDEHVARLALRNRTLRTAIEEYRRLIEDPSTRLPTRWFTVRLLTLNALGVSLSEETPSAWAFSISASLSTSQGGSGVNHGSASIQIPQPAGHTGRSRVPSLTVSNPSSSNLLSDYPNVEQQVAYHAPLSHDQEMLRNFRQSNLQIPLQDSFAGGSGYSFSQGSGSGSGSGAGRVDTGYVSGSPGKDSFDGQPFWSDLEAQD